MTEFADAATNGKLRTLWVSGGVALLLVAAALAGTGFGGFRAREAAAVWERHSLLVIIETQKLLSRLQDAESAQRGYVLSGDATYVEPFAEGARAARAELVELRRLTQDNPAQQSRLDMLDTLVTLRLDRLEAALRLAQSGDSDGALGMFKLGIGRRLMEQARRVIAELIAEEQRLQTARQRDVAQAAARAETSTYALAAIGLLLFIGAAAAGAAALSASSRLRAADVRRVADRRVRESRDMLQDVIDGCADPIFAKDREGRFVVVNAVSALVCGAQRDDMIGKRDSDFLQPEIAAMLVAADRQVMDSGVMKVSDEVMQVDGVPRVFQTSRVPWRQGGAIVGVIGVARDVTDRQAAEHALAELNLALEARVEERARQIEIAQSHLRQLQKMESIGQLTGGIAHDFNNMLAVVLGSLDLARRRLAAEPTKALTYIGQAEDGARRATRLTARLLAFARQQPLAPEPLQVNKLVGNMSELLRRSIGEQMRLETVLSGGLWVTCVDTGQLENTIVNLCVNARDALPDGGNITVETSNAHLDDAYAQQHAEVRAGQYVLISVSDNGQGMAPDIVERAFDPFFTTKTVGRGTGLGLSQVYGFVKQSGGHVKIYSEIGHGTTVKIYLPRYLGPVRHGEAQPEPNERPLGRADEVILVVEDEDQVRAMSTEALRELGYGVLEAPNGIDALAVLDAHPAVRLLFTDIVMPGMNGRRLADEALRRRPELKVLYTTGYTQNAIVHNGVLDPGVALLQKPFGIDALARKIRQLLDAT